MAPAGLVGSCLRARLRAGLRAGLGLALAGASGCSLVLDFGDGAIPADAAIDAPYSAAECEAGEPNDTPAAGTPLAAGATGAAAICAGDVDDRDFYRFTVPAGTTSVAVRVTLASRPGGDLDVRLTDGNGSAVLGQSRGFGDEEAVVCPAQSPACPTLAPGEYAFEVFGALPGSVNRYEYSLVLTP